jgi:hypothetical protein
MSSASTPPSAQASPAVADRLKIDCLFGVPRPYNSGESGPPVESTVRTVDSTGGPLSGMPTPPSLTTDTTRW